MMEKKDILDKLNEMYSSLEDIFDNEGILTAGKLLAKWRDNFGDFTQELEDEIQEETLTKSDKENEND